MSEGPRATPEADAVGMSCPQCGETALPGESFCENCGAQLGGAATPPPAGSAAGSGAHALKATDEGADEGTGEPGGHGGNGAGREGARAACRQCGGDIAPDGYCGTCGAPAVRERDHWLERPAEWVAAVCDRGVRHHRNEDAVALAADPEPGRFAVLVVCDGVSTSADSDVASLAAARAARDVLAGTGQSPRAAGPSVAGRIHGWTRRLSDASQAANEQVVDVAREGGAPAADTSPPSCTFVATVVDGPLLVTGWVGDSRAYWLPDEGEARQLSDDDSWAAEQIAAGMPREEAESAPLAHAITRWLGIDSPGYEPRCVATTPDGPGWLLVCSDGLWNYCSPAADVARLVTASAARHGNDPARMAEELTAWANAQGGRDNITVALARISGPDAPPSPQRKAD